MRNGILLRKDLHSKFGRGEFAFIKTPNYELGPEHIKRFRRGDSRQDYITLHSLQEPQYYDPTMLDALLQNRQSGDLPPGTASLWVQMRLATLDRLLDYAYGVAAFKSWHSKRVGVPNVMRAYREEHYAQIQPLPRDPSDDTDYTSGPDDDPTDPDCIPESRKRYPSTTRRDESELAKAMDELNVVLMYIHGITPEVAAERRQKEIEQKERAAQEASRNKVMEWRKHLHV
ncbi:hypothetical protein BC826DRAFT_1035981 [Russula brevipes]|nr:hypothetical protein BC826DRAFT_1035981 [Russula brevipes]